MSGETRYYIHPTAIVETDRIGDKTRIWAFAHVLPDVTIGRDCNIGDHCFIENDVEIGNEVVIKNGVSLWAGVALEDRVFVGPNAAFTNYLYPQAKVFLEYKRTRVKTGASIGTNATVLCGITIGCYAMVGAGSVVTRDVPDFALVYGNPARFHGWICRCARKIRFEKDSTMTRCECGCSFEKTASGVEEKESRSE